MILILAISFEVDLRHPENKKDKTNIFPDCTDGKVSHQDNFSDYLNDMTSKNNNF